MSSKLLRRTIDSTGDQPDTELRSRQGGEVGAVPAQLMNHLYPGSRRRTASEVS